MARQAGHGGFSFAFLSILLGSQARARILQQEQRYFTGRCGRP